MLEEALEKVEQILGDLSDEELICPMGPSYNPRNEMWEKIATLLFVA